jgi:putative salt-induced outer membrane protein YdiY
MANNKNNAAALVAWANLVLTCASPALADEIVLANGDRLSGTIVRKETDKLVLKTTYAGELNVDWADIRRISTDEPVTVYLENGNRLIGTLHSDADGSVVVSAADAPPGAPIPIDNLRFLNPSPAVSGEGVKLSGHINAGLSSSSGNTEVSKYYLDAEAVARTRDNRYTLGGHGARTRDSGQVTESNWLAYAKYDHFITRKWYGYANANFQNDRFKDIELRSTAGVGTGYQFLESEKTNLSLEGGLTYVHTDFTDAPNEDYPAGRWALKFDHLLFDTRLKFFHYHEAYVNLEDSQDIFVRSQTGLRVPLIENLDATAQYNYDWDNTPAPGTVRADGMLLMTLGYHW